MKKLLILPFLYCFLSSTPALAQLDKIELFSDASMTSCELNDQAGPRSVYVYLTGTATATAVRFKAALPACWVGATFVGDVTSFTTIGDSQVDMSVAFGLCLTPPVLVDQINFFSAGTASACCQ